MPVIDLTKAIDFVTKVFKAGRWSQQVRNDMIDRATAMNTAILMAATHTVGRLNQALRSRTRNEKIEGIQKLTSLEIEEFSRVNELCGQIYSTANAIEHWFSNEWANVNIRGRQEARDVIQMLLDGEGGMQVMFMVLINPPEDLERLSDSALDDWIREKINELGQICETSSKAARRLAKVI